MRVCPWWLGPLLASPIRRLWQHPRPILAPHLGPGMTVLEPGPGMGFFTLEAARLVGPTGRVVAVDVQQKMLDGLRRRAERAGLGASIETRLARGDDLGVEDLAGRVDLVLALWVVHELPDQARFFGQVRRALRRGGRILIVEPRGHVHEADFVETLRLAEAAGLVRVEPPPPGPGWIALLLAP
ncbi:MAG TPA: methyltransferase domain-containing protein [Anaeromyxobacteraceae bacterium]|nr:methyltransferase domain-containing protein [Anaeromyxobacteraceae bacterium]